MITLVLGLVLSAAVTRPLTVPRVLAEAIMFTGLFGPMYLAPRRYTDWAARCRLPGFGGRASAKPRSGPPRMTGPAHLIPPRSTA